jgi:hypothetical protein
MPKLCAKSRRFNWFDSAYMVLGRQVAAWSGAVESFPEAINHMSPTRSADVLTELVERGMRRLNAAPRRQWSSRSASVIKSTALGRFSIGLSLFSLTEWGQE